uniref:Uncharacterized protein n=1 Tax=Rhizophora mucronata TaxID=61149 RepID=A0A2P2JAX5_RHIMU
MILVKWGLREVEAWRRRMMRG